MDESLIRISVDLAKSAVEHGNHPFGALLADKHGNILLTAENTTQTPYTDFTGHAETNLVRKAGQELSAEVISNSTLYTSTEPCAMCSGAICWAGIKRVVFACRESVLQQYAGEYLSIPCREIFSRCTNHVEVVGPILEEEASKVHEHFWVGYDTMQRKHVDSQ
eukprot:TRINITY_DN2871_c0_g1_i2.p1 TRINITY_DN2871_c0_g1~~TRINITY_DN2871_c0_g1_i2.p1  ORF type:complete len:164 (-),score=21.01 TRINITY_DN2871_c0_g1_i2:53-544(-)